MRAAVAALLIALAPAPLAAQAAPAPGATAVKADPAVRARADQLVGLLKGGGDYAAFFTPAFQQAVSRAQIAGIAKSLADSLGPVRGIASVQPTGSWSALLVVDFERGTANAAIALDPAAPHAVAGLRFTGTQRRDDSLAAVTADAQALPGTVGLGVYALGDGAPRPLIALHDDRPMPLASAFKLWVLADLAKQIAEGRHRWADVVPIGPPSLPSGVLQTWPAGAPVTLQTLATQMISISDNTATDTLIGVLGRARIEASAAAAGLAPPLLTTREAFVLKGDPALTRQWAAADVPGKQALLAREAPRIAAAPFDPMLFSHGSLATDSVEWFAAPRDAARLLDGLRRTGGATPLAILAVNHGADPATTARFAYLGFKGGSEPGVLTLNFLARTADDRWYAVAGAWHRPDGETDELRFLTLMTRALNLVAAQPAR